MQPPTDRPRAPVRHLRRYAPFAVIAAVVAIVAVFLGSRGGDGKQRADRPASGGPLTFADAKRKGIKADFGASCDPATGRIQVPSVYAPPCVEAWKGGDNGGATSPGVTSTEITVVYYSGKPDPLQDAFLRGAGTDTDTGRAKLTAQGYVDYFNAHYQMYGRMLRLELFDASGGPADPVAAKADAITIATELKPFAVWGGPTQTTAFADELAARGVVCVGACSLAVPERFSRARQPFLWSTGPSIEQAQTLAAEMIGTQLAGAKAEYAGDPTLQRRTRTFGAVHYDTAEGTYRASFSSFVGKLQRRGIKLAVDVPYVLDLTKSAEDARGIIAKLRDAGVTTVVFSGDPIMPSFLTREATAQGYSPEWVFADTVLVDATVLARTYDQQQWAHAFGLSLLPARGTLDTQDPYHVYVWQHGRPPPSRSFGVIYPGGLTLSTGIHLAGADLTPQTFRDGLFRYPVTGGGPTRATVSRGRHHIWPGTDIFGSDDATLVWWDPTATGPDEIDRVGKGMYEYAAMGARYRPGRWPKTKIPLFDPATSVTVFRQQPLQDQAPDYPRPVR